MHPAKKQRKVDEIESDSTSTKSVEPKVKNPKSTSNGEGIISPRDERGTPYPKDWPNPLDGTYRGCF